MFQKEWIEITRKTEVARVVAENKLDAENKTEFKAI